MDIYSCLIVYHFLVMAFFTVADCSDVSIVGGEDVTKLKPWMVSIQKDQKHVCGGILIKSQWVLTAANCKEKPEKSVTVLIGTLSLSQKTKGSQRVGILRYFSPSTFREQTRQDDIMLIKLNKKVKVKTKTLPRKEQDIRPETRCVVTGWGTKDSKRHEASDKLQMLEVTVMNSTRCNHYYKDDLMITKDMLCAANMQSKRGTCWGDSGGPLECKKNIVGVVSGSKKCGDPTKPTVYTFLSERHISWIKSILKSQHRNNIVSSIVRIQ